MADAMLGNIPGFLALILFDDSHPSQRLKKVMEKRYVDLDRLTGDDLLVLSDVEPPEQWFRSKLDEYRHLPDWAQSSIREDLESLRTKSGKLEAKINSQKMIGDLFENEERLPALCFVQPRSAGLGDDVVHLDARALDFSGISSEGAVVDAFKYLAKVSREGRERPGFDAIALAEEASSWKWKSLRWRNAMYRTLDLHTLVSIISSNARGVLRGDKPDG